MGMDGGLGLAGRTGRIEPEAHVVAHRRRRHRVAGSAGEQLFEWRVPVGVGARHDHLRRFRRRGNCLGEFRIELIGHDQEPRPAVLEHEAVVVLGQKRIDRHRHHAGLDGAEKSRRPVDRVDETQEHTLLAAKPKRAQHMTEAFDAPGEIAIGPALVRRTLALIDIGELAGATGVEIALEDVGGEIVIARDRFERRAQ